MESDRRKNGGKRRQVREKNVSVNKREKKLMGKIKEGGTQCETKGGRRKK